MKVLVLNNYPTSVSSKQQSQIDNRPTFGFKNITTYSSGWKVMTQLITKGAINRSNGKALLSSEQLGELAELINRNPTRTWKITVGPCYASSPCTITIERPERKPDYIKCLNPYDPDSLDPFTIIKALLLLDETKLSRSELVSIISNFHF